MSLVISITKGQRSGEELRFDALSISVGRSEQCALILPDKGISRHHCDLIVHQGELWLQDQGTTNGTKLNGAFVNRARVANGSEISFGPVAFRVVLEGAQGLEYRDMHDYRGLLQGRSTGAATPIPHPSLRGGNRWVEVGLSKEQRLIRIVGGIAAVAILVLVTLSQLDRGGIEAPTNSGQTIEITPNQTDPRSIGFSERRAMDVSTLGTVSLRFDQPAGLSLLTMEIASIDTPRELELRLNDKSLLFAKQTQGWLVGGVSVVLPPALLKAEGNVLELVHRVDEPKQRSWGVRNVRLRQFPASEANLEGARQGMEMGKARYRSKKVHPHNLPAAVRLFREAALSLIAIDPRPPLFDEAVQRYAQAESDLVEEFRRSYLDAQRATQLEGRNAACRVIDTMIRRFTDQDDWRYLKSADLRRDVCSKKVR